MEAKRQFDDRTKGDRLEELYDAAYFYWYNRLRKLRRTKADTEKIEKVEASFKAFRAEAIQKKTAVKKDLLSLSDFSGWLIRQQDVIDQLMEE